MLIQKWENSKFSLRTKNIFVSGHKIQTNNISVEWGDSPGDRSGYIQGVSKNTTQHMARPVMMTTLRTPAFSINNLTIENAAHVNSWKVSVLILTNYTCLSARRKFVNLITSHINYTTLIINYCKNIIHKSLTNQSLSIES